MEIIPNHKWIFLCVRSSFTHNATLHVQVVACFHTCVGHTVERKETLKEREHHHVTHADAHRRSRLFSRTFMEGHSRMCLHVFVFYVCICIFIVFVFVQVIVNVIVNVNVYVNVYVC